MTGLLLDQFPAVLGQALGAAALGFDGGDIDHQVLGFRGGEAGDELHFELRVEFEVDDAFLQRFGQAGADLAEELDALERVDHALGNQVARHHLGFLQPARRPGEDGFVGLIEFLAAGQQAHRVGDVLAGGGDQLQGEAVAIVGIVLAHPAQRVLDDLEFLVVEIDDVALERGLAEHPVHEPAGFLLVEVEGGVAVFAMNARKCSHSIWLEASISSAASWWRSTYCSISFFSRSWSQPVGLGFRDLEARLVDRGHQAELDRERGVLRRPLVDLLDAVIPRGDLALLLPVGHFLLHVAEVGDHVHELRIGELLLVERVGEVVPELEDVAGRHRPQFERFVGGDFPPRVDAHHVVVVEFPLDHVAAVTLLDLGDEVRLLVVEFAAELLLDDVQHRRVVEFVGRLRQVLAAVHALHHRGILAGAGDQSRPRRCRTRTSGCPAAASWCGRSRSRPRPAPG